MLTRRNFLAAASAAVTVRGDQPLPLIDDPQFRRGLNVLTRNPAKPEPAGVIAPAEAVAKPVWRGAQWYSHFNLADAKRETLPSGSSRFFDGGKAVTFGAPASPEADLVLSLDGRAEYGDHAPEKGQPWPHLIAEQELVHRPKIAQLKAVPFRIQYHLLKSEAFHLPGWDDQRHTAQFLLYITVQNGNRTSPGHGDFLWFGVAMYDARTPLPLKYAAPDNGSALKLGTGKFIFIPSPAEAYSSKPAKEGEWIAVDRDLLPLMREGLETAWTAGFLKDSRNIEDFELAGMNVGWEVTGPLAATMQIRGLSLASVANG